MSLLYGRTYEPREDDAYDRDEADIVAPRFLDRRDDHGHEGLAADCQECKRLLVLHRIPRERRDLTLKPADSGGAPNLPAPTATPPAPPVGWRVPAERPGFGGESKTPRRNEP